MRFGGTLTSSVFTTYVNSGISVGAEVDATDIFRASSCCQLGQFETGMCAISISELFVRQDVDWFLPQNQKHWGAVRCHPFLGLLNSLVPTGAAFMTLL